MSVGSTIKENSSIDLPNHQLSSGLRTDSMDFMTGLFLLSISAFCF